MASLTMKGYMGATRTANTIMEGVLASGLSCELVGSVSRRMGGEAIYIMVFEKYYMRASNIASLTAVVTGDGTVSTVDVISSGGGKSPIFKFSFGAEESFVGTVEVILRRNGFEKV